MHPGSGPSLYGVNSHCASSPAAIPRRIPSDSGCGPSPDSNGHSLRPSSTRLLVAQARESRLDGSQHATRAGASEPQRDRLASVQHEQQRVAKSHRSAHGRDRHKSHRTGDRTALRQGGIGCCSAGEGPSARGAAAQCAIRRPATERTAMQRICWVCLPQAPNVPMSLHHLLVGPLHLQLLSRLYGTRRPTVAHPPVTPLFGFSPPIATLSQQASTADYGMHCTHSAGGEPGLPGLC